MKKALSAAVLAVTMVCVPLISNAGYVRDYNTADGKYHGGDRNDYVMRYVNDGNDTRMERRMQARGYYVCYRSRMTVRDNMGNERARYRGCMTSTRSCASMGKNHFGQYNNSDAMEDALDRCMLNQPRFID